MNVNVNKHDIRRYNIKYLLYTCKHDQLYHRLKLH